MFVLLTENKLHNQNIRHLAPRRKDFKKVKHASN
jgi:hypothetical protein